MSDERRDAPASGAQREEWDEVVAALTMLGASVGRATKAAVDDEENRRRLRELRAGLEALARRLGDSLEGAIDSPAGDQARAAVAGAVATVATAGERIADEVRPEALEAFRLANEKFKQAADTFDRPAAPAAESTPAQPEPAGLGAPVAAAPPVDQVAPAVASAADFPGASAAASAAPSVPAAVPAPSPAAEPMAAPVIPRPTLPPELIEAVRATNERFRAERKAAVEAAAATSFAALAADTEPVAVPDEGAPTGSLPESDGATSKEIAPEAGGESAAEERTAADEGAPSEPAAHEGPLEDDEDPVEDSALDDLEALLAEGPDDWQEPTAADEDRPSYAFDPVTGERNAPAPTQGGLFDSEYDTGGENGARPEKGTGLDFGHTGPDVGAEDGYTP